MRLGQLKKIISNYDDDCIVSICYFMKDGPFGDCRLYKNVGGIEYSTDNVDEFKVLTIVDIDAQGSPEE